MKMRYIWEQGKKGAMHITGFDPKTGAPTMKALCGIRHNFNRSINAPFALGRPVCKRCKKQMTV